MVVLLWLTVVLPAAAAMVVTCLRGRAATGAAILGAAAALVPALALLIGAADGRRVVTGGTWLPAANLDVGLRLDGLSAAMAVTVATVGLVVVVYAAGYFAGHARSRSALAGLLAFLAAMQGLILADGFLALLVGWELVGALSCRLIAFNREDVKAPGGAVRAFLTTRGADVGLYLAVLALYSADGNLAFTAERPGGTLGILVGLGLVVAATGKSAQAPLQTWLSGAMAGPTPVSALLHSATMVAAGVYLLMRNDALLEGWPLLVAGWVGAITAVAGAAIALAQQDLKRVLAGSTTSQLGLMFVGVAAGGPAVGLFHLVAHAAGKATMFLGAGLFQRARGTTALEGLRGAGRDDPRTFAAFAVGAASIAAVPPLAAFWSKDAILAAAEDRPAWLALSAIAAAGSAAYLLRPLLVLWGRPQDRRQAPAAAGRPAMLVSTRLLAAASFVLGAAGAPLASLLDVRTPVPTALSLGLSLSMLAAGVLVVLRRPRVPAALTRAAEGQFGAEPALRAVLQRPLLAMASAADALDRHVVDRVVSLVARATVTASRAADALDGRVLDPAVDANARATLRVAGGADRLDASVPTDGPAVRSRRPGIDTAVDGVAHLVARAGRDSTRLQTGHLHEYLRDTVLGAGAIGLILLLTALF